MLDEIKRLVNGIVGADQEIGSSLGQFTGGGEHEFRYTRPIAGIDVLHVLSQRVGMQGHFGMLVSAEPLRPFVRDGAVAEGRSLGAAGDDADV